MQTTAWLILFAIVGVLGFGVWLLRQRWLARAQAAEARQASFMAGFAPKAPPPATAPAKDTSGVTRQKLLFEAAMKAGEAGEPALSIQLYARLIGRYPESPYAGQARAAVEMQKKKLAAKA